MALQNSSNEIIVTPWSSDSEWQSLRQDIFGNKDTSNYKQALRKLLLWKSRGKSLCRGLYCTEIILQVIVKDVYFYEVEEPTNESDLIRLYSMAIMKFVNLTADIIGKGPQKSMYYRASRLQLPSWLIDMRHKISHDQDLPTLKSLRVAMEFALEWLQIHYWNNDENFLVIPKKVHIQVVYEFKDLLEFYILSKSQTNAALKQNKLNVLREKLNMSECSNKECVKKIKDLIAIKDWSSDLVNVFTTQYLSQAHECNVSKGRISKTDKAIWNVLFKTFNNSGLLTNVLQCLVTHHSRISALWVLELCIVTYKSSKKIDLKNNQNDNCMNCKPMNLDANLVLRTALQSPHLFTNIFLKWLLQIQLSPLKVKQYHNIIKLVSLYTGEMKVSSKNIDQNNIFTVDDLSSKDETDHQSQWSKAFGLMNWRQVQFGTTL
ncbi:PREDICTED: uncharacterized protein LOC107173474 isoform X2 [Diuraphis noxia]|uniref:uncharacterized protein LOC107173474 isoform X2 n=1 Tax=Diuraphis noxia TaxID=143948 RepID=UPI000763B82A|nr:PREDICTED: uncharacterized protein LOC107173474 isoform X2 [Diuraphis noxia]